MVLGHFDRTHHLTVLNKSVKRLWCQIFGADAWFKIFMLEQRAIENMKKKRLFAAQSWGESLNDTI